MGKISNSKFINNYANLSGGALRVNSEIIIENSIFSYNEAQDGGAVYITFGNNREGTISNCRFTNNIAEDKGGAMYFLSNGMSVSENYYSQNSARNGGAVYAFANNNLFFDNEEVIANFAEYGGGFYLYTPDYCPVKVRYSTFLNNTAYKLGAGVYYYGTSNNKGYSEVDALNSDENEERATVHDDKGYLTWKISHWQNPVVHTYFGGSVDNYLGVEATPKDMDVVIEVSIPKDADQGTADITLVIKHESGSENTYHYDSADARWNYDNVNHSARTVVTLTLTNQQIGDYNVRATFKDGHYYVYERKGNTTYTITRPQIKGNFTILQELIDEAISSKTYVVDLDRDYTYSIGLDNGQMNIYENLTINGNGHFLDALGYCRIFSVSGDDVVLNNIVFTNGDADGVDGTLADHENGGAIFWSDVDKATVNNCTFTDNTATNAGALFCSNIDDLYINDSVFAYNTASNYAGAVLCNCDNSRISACDFINNTASDTAGAIYWDGANGYIGDNCNFRNNSATEFGGAIYWIDDNGVIFDCNFTNNTSQNAGAIMYQGKNLTVNRSTFELNKATASFAGAVHIDGDNSKFINSSFINNSASQYGGAINCDYSKDMAVYNCTFALNYAGEDGGAVCCLGENLVVSNASTFTSNYAGWEGGAIYSSGVNSRISNSTFKSNYVEFQWDMGGAIYSSGDNIIISDATFESNHVSDDYSAGGAIYSTGNDLKISGATFKSNFADFGGAIDFEGENSNVAKCNFEFNNATSGSAIYWSGDNGKLSDSTFLNNKADAESLSMQDDDLTLTITLNGKDNYINAIFSWEDLTFENVTYFNGATVNSDDVTPVKSNRESGQPIVLKIYDGNVLKQTVDGITDVNGQFIYDYSVLDSGIYSYKASHEENNYYTAIDAQSGFKFGDFDLLQHQINKAGENAVLTLARNYTYTIGVDTITNGVVIRNNNLTINGNNYTIDALFKSRIFYVTSDDIVLNNITFVNGTAGDGGAIYVETNADELEIANSTFKKNVAKVYGGAIFWDSETGNINNAVFDDNHVFGTRTSGGAVYWNTSNCNISHTDFTNNHATNCGGALYCNGANTNLDYVNFTDNHATNNGGAVYVESDCKVTNSNFNSNYVTEGSGGAIYCNGAGDFNNVNFTANHAAGAGGGALFVKGTANIDNTRFSQDYAVNEGGAVYLQGANSKVYNSVFEETHAMNGGAIQLQGTGGTIYNTKFIGTYSNWNGGAVYWTGSDGTMALTNFTDVRAAGNGGAVYWIGDDGEITRSNFTNASALSGGAIYWIGDNGVVSKSRFNSTKSTSVADPEGGGAISWKSSNGKITNCNFTNSTANFNGGAIHLGSANQELINISINDSSALNNGGAIYLASGALNADLTNITIFNTSALNGGGLYVNAKGATFTNSNITNSSADNGGGAVYWMASGGEIKDINLLNNSAKDGGAFYAGLKSGDSGSTTLTNVAFENNSASDNGGAVCFNGYANGYSVYDSTFKNNTANDKGYSVYYYAGSSDTLNNSIYNSNFTGKNHIYIESSMRATLENNTELNAKNSDYFVYSKGTLALSKNTLKNLIVNYGTVLTEVNVTVCENKTYTFDNFFFPLNATAVDDNGNALVSNSLKFHTNHADSIESEIDEDIHRATLITNKPHYEVDITDVGLKKTNVKIAIINIIAKLGSYTWLQQQMDSFEGSEYVLTRNVTFNPDYDLSIYNIYYGKINFLDGMNYNKTFTFQGENYTISGFNQARIFNMSADGVTINNTNFVNGSNSAKGGALYITADNVVIANSTFKNNTAGSGGAISSLSNSGLTLGNLSFVNNTARNIGAVELAGVSDAQISDLEFANNSATNDCGALSFIGSGNALTLSDCSFTNNTARNYGAVYVSNVNVESCSFENNTAKADYSALYIAGGNNALTLTTSNFTGNKADGIGTVGVANANAKVTYCNFTDNSAGASASAIYVNAQGVTISNDTFDKNTAGANGTVWLASTSGKVLDCNFTGNDASYGAGVYVCVNENVLINNSQFTLNVAKAEAGAVYFMSSSGKIQYCNFTNNTAVNGGAIVIAGTLQDIGYCNFTGNNATYKCGSIYVKEVSNNVVHDSTFKNSYAFDGGAVYNSGSTGATLRLLNDTFIKNIASHNGGAVYYIVDADTTPVIYRDYLNFTADGITSDGVVDAAGRTTVTMKSAGSTYQRIIDCYFKDNEDYLLNISATVFEQNTMAVVNIYNPKDADKGSVRIVITVNSTDGSYNKQVIINESNYDRYFNAYLKTFAVNFYNLTEDADYNVTVSFEDAVYLYKINSTKFHMGTGGKMGDFKFLQSLIDAAIQAPQANTPYVTPTVTLPRDIVFTIGDKSWCDDSCMNITAPIIIDGLGRSIDALGQSRIFNITSANVTLINIKFVNGNSSGRYADNVDKGGALFWAGENGTVSNCDFRDNNASTGGAIYYNSTAGHGKVSGCYFYNNTATTNGGAIECNASEMNLTNTVFESNYAGEFGAALCRESNATGGFGRNNNFTSNFAGKAGAALAWLGVNNITINEYVFTDNLAGENGGAIYVDANSNNCTVKNSVFIGNNVTSTTSGSGGAIDWIGANGTVLDSFFTNNNAYEGGAIYVGSATGHTNITGSTFTKNGAFNNGGAINLIASSVTVNTSNFYDNSAKNGGALYVGGEGKTNYVYSSVFENNSASEGRGGAINWVASTGEIMDSNFTNNSANYGGGVYFGLKSKDSKIDNVIFTNNSATKNGGAIDWNSTGGQLYNTQFISNYAREYGAALCREANATGGHGDNNNFTSNHAGIAGAALAWMDSAKITITNYNFIKNTADEKGGAIYINENSHNCSIIECNFDLNEVTNLNTGHGGAIDCEASNATILKSNFTNNFAYEGGAIHIDSSSGHTNITNSTFDHNRALGAGGAINLEASSVTVNGSNFTYNTASDGGALYVGGAGLTNYVYNSNFEFNDAGSGHGGAIDWRASTGHIVDSNFTLNSAEYGGAVYLNGNSKNSKITGSRFISNIANTNGGAIDWNATSGNLTNNYFYSNYAGEYGAALCREANATGGFGYNNVFEYNYAEIAGAGIAWMNVGNIKIDTYYFRYNTAGLGGAGIYIGHGSDNATILNCEFKANNITNDTGGYGGAIYCIAENTTINNTNFTNNNAFYGGAICVGTGSGHTKINSTNFTDNHAVKYGGALYLKSSSIINNTNFKENTAGDGGAIYVDGVSDDNHVYSSVFEQNQANGGHGGAINWGSSAGHIVDSNFTLNSAEYGGGVYLGGNSTNSRITNVIFANNTATRNGGAIDWNATGGNLTNTTFKYNYAEYGAALCREANATGGFGYNNTFDSNHASKSGAALAWLGVDNIVIRKYTFINNTADYSGGAIYVSERSDNCKVINSTFTDNYVSNAVVGRGGAIDWIGNNAYVFNSTFTGSFSPEGGAIYIDDKSNNAKILNSSFTSCISLSDGGAIHLNGNNALISYSNFTSSVAIDNGGAIAGIGSDNSNIDNCIFKYNIAAGRIDSNGVPYAEGGAIYWENSKGLEVSNSIFNSNDAHLAGGDISANNCNDSVIYNINTFNATAATNGGSISWRNSKNLIIEKSYFNDSGANYKGGSIYLSNMDAAIKNTGINSS